MSENTQNRKGYRQEIVDEIIEHLEKGTAPWQKPWMAGQFGAAPFNPTTNRSYAGINQISLDMAGYSDPRWMTYKQAQSVGASVRKGERGRTVEYWKWTDIVQVLDDKGQPVPDENGEEKRQTVRLARPVPFYARVFNAEQIDGLAPYVAPAPSFDPVERAEKILQGSGIAIKHDQNSRAFYRPGSDSVHLPPMAAFPDASKYYETALHELGHATGHGSRLARQFGPFGSDVYAREELRAELSSAMLARDLGIGHDPANHASYVDSWLKVLKQDKNEIFRAARDAEIIHSWTMQPELRPVLEREAHERRKAEMSITQKAVSAAKGFFTGQTPPLPAPPPEMPSAPIANQEASPEKEPAGRTYINVPREEKDEAKALGARWDRKAVSWYVPDSVELEKFAKWPVQNLEPAPEVPSAPIANQEASPEKEPAGRTYINVPREEKDEAKALGARWDRKAVSWYVPDGVELEPFKKWPEIHKGFSGTENSPGSVSEKIADQKEPQKERLFIDVPYAEKNEAKGLGARWDKAAKSWYVPQGVDPAQFAKWTAAQAKSALLIERSDPQHEFADQLKLAGLRLDGPPVMNGEWHRVAVEGDHKGQKSGSYRGFLDGIPSGQITNYKAGMVAEKWVATGIQLTEADRKRLVAEASRQREERAKALEQAFEQASRKAFGVWSNLHTPATSENCRYLASKGVEGYGVKVDEYGKLIVPVRDEKGKLWSFQAIGEEKRFLTGGAKAGLFHVVEPTGAGTLESIKDSPMILIAEGYATAATLHEVTGHPVIVAFDAGNLSAVAHKINAAVPNAELVLAADNDHAHKTENVGIRRAEETAKALGTKYIYPDFTVEEKAQGLTDFNDLKASRGASAVLKVVRSVVPEKNIRNAPAPAHPMRKVEDGMTMSM